MLVENLRFWLPTSIRCLGLGWSRWNFAEIFGNRQLQFLGYRKALFVCVDPRFSHLCRTCDRRTNGQTDRRTNDDSIYHASISSRGKMNEVWYFLRFTRKQQQLTTWKAISLKNEIKLWNAGMSLIQKRTSFNGIITPTWWTSTISSRFGFCWDSRTVYQSGFTTSRVQPKNKQISQEDHATAPTVRYQR